MSNTPAFFVVGAAKAGTTALHHILSQHPDLFLPRMKETNFFAFAHERVDFKGPLDEETINKFSITSPEAYAALFRRAGPHQLCGEVCPSYLYIEKAAGAIFDHLPTARIVIILRNPAERAFSNYLQLVRDGRERASFAEALAAEDARRLAGWEWFWHLYSVGLYAVQVRRYLSTFGRDRVLLLLYEHFKLDPQHDVERIFRFLGVDPHVPIDYEREYNVSGRPRERLRRVYDALIGPTALNRALRRLLPESLRRKAGAAFKARATRPEAMDPAQRRALMQRYAQDIEPLEAETGLDCSVWRDDSRALASTRL